jgi:hypothetical protein
MSGHYSRRVCMSIRWDRGGAWSWEGRAVTVRVARRPRLLAGTGAVVQAGWSGAGAGMAIQRGDGLEGRRLRAVSAQQGCSLAGIRAIGVALITFLATRVCLSICPHPCP